jgi:uncharacterized membrane protein YedE/YeeE
MDYEQFITEVGIQPLQLYLGLAMGLAFGIGVTLRNFCLRRLVLDLPVIRFSSASYTWLFGLSITFVFTQLLLQEGTGDISEAQIITAQTILSGSIIGGLMFGFGMMLSRDCSVVALISSYLAD